MAGLLVGTSRTNPTVTVAPSADNVHCTGARADGGNAGKWYVGSTCFDGYATPISFSLTGVTLPNRVIVSLAYNTTHNGYAPIGASACSATSAGCGYDSLNVGLNAPPSVGSDPLPDDAYLNSSYGGSYCDGGVGGTSTFRLDSGCWTDSQPAVKIEATPPAVGPPTSKDQCKNGGWKVFNNPPFANQGACVSFVENHQNGNGNHQNDGGETGNH